MEELDASQKLKAKNSLDDEQTFATDTMDNTWDTSQRSRVSQLGNSQRSSGNQLGNSQRSRVSQQLTNSNHSPMRNKDVRRRGRFSTNQQRESKEDLMGGSSPCQFGGSSRRRPDSPGNTAHDSMGGSYSSHSPRRASTALRRNGSVRADSGTLGSFRKRRSSRSLAMDSSANNNGSFRSRRTSTRTVGTSTMEDGSQISLRSRRRNSRQVVDASTQTSTSTMPSLMASNSGPHQDGRIPDITEGSMEASNADLMDASMANNQDELGSSSHHRRCTFKLLEDSYSGHDQEELAYLDLSLRPCQNRRRGRPNMKKQHSDMHLVMSQTVNGFARWVDDAQASVEKLARNIGKAAEDPELALKDFVHARVDTFTSNIKTIFSFSFGCKHGAARSLHASSCH